MPGICFRTADDELAPFYRKRTPKRLLAAQNPCSGSLLDHVHGTRGRICNIQYLVLRHALALEREIYGSGTGGFAFGYRRHATETDLVLPVVGECSVSVEPERSVGAELVLVADIFQRPLGRVAAENKCIRNAIGFFACAAVILVELRRHPERGDESLFRKRRELKRPFVDTPRAKHLIIRGKSLRRIFDPPDPLALLADEECAADGSLHDIRIRPVSANDKPVIVGALVRLPLAFPDEPAIITARKERRMLRAHFQRLVGLFAASKIQERPAGIARDDSGRLTDRRVASNQSEFLHADMVAVKSPVAVSEHMKGFDRALLAGQMHFSGAYPTDWMANASGEFGNVRSAGIEYLVIGLGKRCRIRDDRTALAPKVSHIRIGVHLLGRRQRNQGGIVGNRNITKHILSTLVNFLRKRNRTLDNIVIGVVIEPLG